MAEPLSVRQLVARFNSKGRAAPPPLPTSPLVSKKSPAASPPVAIPGGSASLDTSGHGGLEVRAQSSSPPRAPAVSLSVRSASSSPPQEKKLSPAKSALTLDAASQSSATSPKSLSVAKSALRIDLSLKLDFSAHLISTSPPHRAGSPEYKALVRRMSQKLQVSDATASAVIQAHGSEDVRSSSGGVVTEGEEEEEDDQSSIAEVLENDDEDITRFESPLQRRRRLLGRRASSSSIKASAVLMSASEASIITPGVEGGTVKHDATELMRIVWRLSFGEQLPEQPCDYVYRVLLENRDSFPTFLCDAWHASTPLVQVDGTVMPRPTELPLVVIAGLAVLRVLSTRSAVSFCDKLSVEQYRRILGAGVGGAFPGEVLHQFQSELPPGHCLIRTWESSHFLLQQILFCGFDVNPNKPSVEHELHQAIAVIFSETLADGSPAPEDIYEALIHMAINPGFGLTLVDCAHKQGPDARALTRAIREHIEFKEEVDMADWFDRVEQCLFDILLDLPLDAINNLPDPEKGLVLKGREEA